MAMRNMRRAVEFLRGAYDLDDVEALDVLEIMDASKITPAEAVMKYHFVRKNWWEKEMFPMCPVLTQL